MIDIMVSIADDLQIVILASLTCLALVFVGETWHRKRSWVAALGAVVASAVVLWGVHNYDVLEEEVDKEFEERRTEAEAG